jgi:hypothetical protein
MDQSKIIQFVPARFLESFIAVARELIFRPRRFFEQLQPSGSLFGAFAFLFVCVFLSSLVVANAIGANLPLFAALFASSAVSAVLGTVCLQVVLISPLFNAKLPYEATLSVIAYAYIVELVAWIPLIGSIAKIYGLFLMYFGFKAIHRLQARRAAFAVFLFVMLSGISWNMMIGLTAPEWLDSQVKAIESLINNAL